MLGWVLIGVAAWVAASGVVAVLVGRMVRARDAQVPRDAPRAPRPRPESEAEAPADVPGGERPRSNGE